MEKTHIKNHLFMEFIDELATRITEEKFGEETWTEGSLEENQSDTMIFNEDAQDFYNETYDEYETLTNKMLGVYSDNELNK